MNFSLDCALDLPKEVSSKKFPEGHLVIAKENPSWIVLNDLEKLLFDNLYVHDTIRAAAVSAYETLVDVSASHIEDNTASLLSKISDASFFKDATVIDDDKLALHLYLTNNCNLRCKHCYKDAGERKENELSTSEIKHIIDEFSVQGSSQVVLSGGEVLTRDDFFEIADYIKLKGHQVNVVTNGTLINSKEKAKQLSEVTDFLQISLDGASKEFNDYFRGSGTYEKIIDAINYFEGLDFQVNIGMVVSDYNYEDIKNNLPTLLSEKIKHKNIKINVSGLMDYGRGKFCKTQSYDKDPVEKLFSEASNLGLKQKQWRLPNTKSYDCGYAHSVTIDSNGDIYFCPVASEPLSANLNVRSTPLNRIISYFKDQSASVSVEKIPGCNSCDLEYLCGGGCRLENKLVRGDLLSPECSEERKNAIYKELIKLRQD